MVNNKVANLSDILTGKSEKTDIADTSVGKLRKGIQCEGRTPKNIKYPTERKIVLDKMIEILELNRYNNFSFFISDLEEDEVKTKQIYDLMDDIKKYFSYGRWPYFNKSIPVAYPCTSIAKSIFKEMGITLNSISLRDNVANKIDKLGFRVILK